VERSDLMKTVGGFLKLKAVLLAGLLLLVIVIFREPLGHVLERLRLIEFRDFRMYFGM
jgi:hypothetical protein